MAFIGHLLTEIPLQIVRHPSVQRSRTVTDGEYRTTLDATAAPYRFRVTSKGYEAGLSRLVEKNEKELALVVDLEKLSKP
jgi:hypothetical protein